MRRMLALALLLFGTCGGDVADARRSVREYNEAIVLAYRTGDLSRLRSVACDDEVRKIEALIDLKRSAGLVLESTLLSLEVLSAGKSGEDGMVIDTKERWRYFDRALTPGTSPGPRFLADMHMRYELERAGPHRWRVLKVRTVANEFLEPAGYRLARKTHGEQRHEP